MGRKMANLITFMMSLILTITLISQILIMRDIANTLNGISLDISIVRNILDTLDLYDNLVFMFRIFLVVFGIMILKDVLLFFFKYKSQNKITNLLTDLVNILYIFLAFNLNRSLSKNITEFKNNNLMENFSTLVKFDFKGTRESVETLVIVLVMAIVLNAIRIIFNIIRKKYPKED